MLWVLRGFWGRVGAVGLTANENTLMIVGADDKDMAICAIEAGGGITVVHHGMILEINSPVTGFFHLIHGSWLGSVSGEFRTG